MRGPPFVCHPLSRSHDFCMTRLCIWAACTLPFVLPPWWAADGSAGQRLLSAAPFVLGRGAELEVYTRPSTYATPPLTSAQGKCISADANSITTRREWVGWFGNFFTHRLAFLCVQRRGHEQNKRQCWKGAGEPVLLSIHMKKKRGRRAVHLPERTASGQD